MVHLNPISLENRQVIESYGPGRFVVSGQPFQGSILVTPRRTELLSAQSIADVDVSPMVASLEESRPEVLIIGTGERFERVDAAILDRIRATGTALDQMATPAACRTYNVLLNEDRVAAALMIALSATAQRSENPGDRAG
ncbi:MAG: Mth938-like domain-containing protein [Geminicoccaceae bacterium]